MKTNDCKYCGGAYKNATTEYTIRSRHSEQSETTIENLNVDECTICGHIEMTESSEKYIEIIRQKIRREMEKQSEIAQTYSASSEPIDRTLDISLKNIKNFFKKFTG